MRQPPEPVTPQGPPRPPHRLRRRFAAGLLPWRSSPALALRDRRLGVGDDRLAAADPGPLPIPLDLPPLPLPALPVPTPPLPVPELPVPLPDRRRCLNCRPWSRWTRPCRRTCAASVSVSSATGPGDLLRDPSPRPPAPVITPGWSMSARTCRPTCAASASASSAPAPPPPTVTPRSPRPAVAPAVACSGSTRTSSWACAGSAPECSASGPAPSAPTPPPAATPVATPAVAMAAVATVAARWRCNGGGRWRQRLVRWGLAPRRHGRPRGCGAGRPRPRLAGLHRWQPAPDRPAGHRSGGRRGRACCDCDVSGTRAECPARSRVRMTSVLVPWVLSSSTRTSTPIPEGWLTAARPGSVRSRSTISVERRSRASRGPADSSTTTTPRGCSATCVRRVRREPEDLTSEVFLRVFDRLPQFTGDEPHFRSWLFTIAHRILIDDARRRQRRPQTTVLGIDVETAADRRRRARGAGQRGRRVGRRDARVVAT